MSAVDGGSCGSVAATAASSTGIIGGGSGAGVNITPVAFLVVKDGNVRMINAQPASTGSVEKVVDAVPEILDKVKAMIPKKDKSEAE